MKSRHSGDPQSRLRQVRGLVDGGRADLRNDRGKRAFLLQGPAAHVSQDRSGQSLPTESLLTGTKRSQLKHPAGGRYFSHRLTLQHQRSTSCN